MNGSNVGFLDVLVHVGSLLHQGLVVQQLEGVHLLPILLRLLISHLGHKDLLVAVVHVLYVFRLVLLVLLEVLGLNYQLATSCFQIYAWSLLISCSASSFSLFSSTCLARYSLISFCCSSCFCLFLTSSYSSFFIWFLMCFSIFSSSALIWSFWSLITVSAYEDIIFLIFSSLSFFSRSRSSSSCFCRRVY